MQDFVTGESDPLLDPIVKSYYESNLNLARTIAVKSSRVADAQEQYLDETRTDAANYFNGAQSPKADVDYLAVANIPLTGNLPLLVDGGEMDDGDVISLVAQTNLVENGPYVFASSGNTYTLTRRSDFTSLMSIKYGAYFGVKRGTTYAAYTVVLTTPDPITVDTTPLTFIYVNLASPTTWKYYMNLAGQYHPTDYTDVKAMNKTLPQYKGLPDSSIPNTIQISSLDTQLPMAFTVENLQISPNTKAEYRFGTRYYLQLVAQYPEQEDLIMGIIMPCDMNTAIAAEDGTILRYDVTLVESNEFSLIKELETLIKNHMFRVYVDAYRQTDEYFLMAYFGNLALFVIMKLFNLREARRLTYEAHSFHVKMLLKSYMNLDQFYQYMTQKQAMYLYRNLPRLVKSIGFNTQFTELIQNILTERNIQIFGYTVAQTGAVDPDYKPISIVKKELLNPGETDPSVGEINLEEMFQNEEGVLYGTKDYYDSNQANVLEEVTNQNQSTALTKDLLVPAQNAVNVYSLTFQDVALRHWAYMTAQGLYSANITFRNPRTDINQTVPAKVAFSYLYYLSLSYTSQSLAIDASKGLSSTDIAALVDYDQLIIPKTVKFIPQFLAEHHVSPTTPTVGGLAKVVELAYRQPLLPAINTLISEFVPLVNTASVDQFHTLCVNIFKNYIYQNTLANSFADRFKRGYVKNMMYNMYRDTMVQFYPSTYTVEQFLQDNNLDSYETLGGFLAELVNNLYQAGTGTADNSTTSQDSITAAMVSIMRSLSDYNIQYINQGKAIETTLVRNEPPSINGYSSARSDGSTSFVEHFVRLRTGVIVQDVTFTPN